MQAQKTSRIVQSPPVVANDVTNDVTGTAPEPIAFRPLQACESSDIARISNTMPMTDAPNTQENISVMARTGLRPENAKLSEIHTDRGALGVLSKIVASCDPQGLGKSVTPVKLSAATFYDMLDVLKSQARAFENRLVAASEKQVNLAVNNLRANQKDSVNGAGVEGVNPNALVARVNRLLNNSHVRRGVAVSQQELARRSSLLIDRAACGQPLQYALGAALF